MSLESLEAGSFTLNPPQQETYSTMATETNYAHFDETDQRIASALDGARDEIVISNRTISVHTALLESEVANEETRIIDQAKLERIEARRERDRLMDEIEKTYQQQLSSINQEETESLDEIRQTGNDGKEFFAACKRVGSTINEAVIQYKEKHDELIETVERVHESLSAAQTDVKHMDGIRREKAKQRDELIRDHEATELITKRYRQKRVDLMRSSVDNTDKLNQERRGFESQTPQAEDEINRAFGEYEQQEFTFQRVHSEIMARIGVLDDEIEAAVLDNQRRNDQIIRLRNEMDAFQAEIEGTREYVETLEGYLVRLDAMKQELEQTSVALQDRAEALQIIARGGFEAIDSIPIELQEVVMAAINMKGNRSYEQSTVDYSVAIPNISDSVLQVSVSKDRMPGEAFVAAPNTANESEGKELSVGESVETLTEGVDVLRKWVQDNTLQLLPDAAAVIPQKMTTPGVRAHVRVGGK